MLEVATKYILVIAILAFVYYLAQRVSMSGEDLKKLSGYGFTKVLRETWSAFFYAEFWKAFLAFVGGIIFFGLILISILGIIFH